MDRSPRAAWRPQRAGGWQCAQDGTSRGETRQEDASLADPPDTDTCCFWHEALAEMEPNVLRAVYLQFQGFKEASKEPTEITSSRLLGVSDRTVRTYLRTGERLLREWMEAGN